MEQAPINTPRHHFAIGIDPDKDKNGVALWSIAEQKVKQLLLLTMPETVRFCREYRNSALVYLEAGHTINYIWGLKPGWNQQQCASKGRDVGTNHGTGYGLIQFFEDEQIAFVPVVPNKKFMEFTPDMVRRCLGYDERNSEKISAARLVIGR